MGDQDPLLLTSGERPDPGVGEALGVDVVEHLLDQLALGLGAPAEAVALGVQAEGHQVAGPDGDVGIEEHLLGDIAQRPSAPPGGPPRTRTWPGVRSLETEDDPQERRLADPVGADEPGELPLADLERDVVEDLATREGDADALDLEDRWRGAVHRCSVEIPCTTAALIAATSASIQDW